MKFYRSTRAGIINRNKRPVLLETPLKEKIAILMRNSGTREIIVLAIG